METLLGILKNDEQVVIRELEGERLALLDEDGLLALPKRVRRAHKKHTKKDRRKAAQGAEILEEELERVNDRVAVVAGETSEKLKSVRLTQTQASRATGPASVGSDSGGVGSGQIPGQNTGAGILRSQSGGAQRQAKRNSKYGGHSSKSV